MKNNDKKILTGLAFLVGSAFIKDKDTKAKAVAKGLQELLSTDQMKKVIEKSDISPKDKKIINDHIIDIDFEEVK